MLWVSDEAWTLGFYSVLPLLEILILMFRLIGFFFIMRWTWMIEDKNGKYWIYSDVLWCQTEKGWIVNVTLYCQAETPGHAWEDFCTFVWDVKTRSKCGSTVLWAGVLDWIGRRKPPDYKHPLLSASCLQVSVTSCSCHLPSLPW